MPTESLSKPTHITEAAQAYFACAEKSAQAMGKPLSHDDRALLTACFEAAWRMSTEVLTSLLIKEVFAAANVIKADYLNQQRATMDFNEKNIFAEGQTALNHLQEKLQTKFGLFLTERPTPCPQAIALARQTDRVAIEQRDDHSAKKRPTTPSSRGPQTSGKQL